MEADGAARHDLDCDALQMEEDLDGFAHGITLKPYFKQSKKNFQKSFLLWYFT